MGEMGWKVKAQNKFEGYDRHEDSTDEVVRGAIWHLKIGKSQGIDKVVRW